MKGRWNFVVFWAALIVAMPSGILLAGVIVCQDEDFAGGSGTEEDPWQVSTPDQFNQIRYCLSSHFIQSSDIDMGVEPYNQGQGWQGPGTLQDPFAGSYRGQGYKIHGLTSNAWSESRAGGLFRYNAGLISDVHIRNGNITGTTTSGLLVAGNLENGTISDSSAEGTVQTNPGGAGVLAGYNSGLIETSFAQGSASVDKDFAGGFVASNFGEIRNCWARSHASAFNGNAGGFAGLNSGEIRSSWSHSTASAGTSGLFTPINIFNPTPSPNIIDSFFVGTPGGPLQSGGGYPRTEEQMRSLATFTEAFFPELNDPWDLNIWTQGGEDDDGFPVLRPACISERFAGGTGTQYDPWLMAEPEHLGTMRRCQQDFMALVADIDLQEGTSDWGSDWFPLGAFSLPFSGHLDGRGHVIRNVQVSKSIRSVTGFFGDLSGIVENLGIENIEVSGEDLVGGLSGRLSGIVRNVWVTGEISGQTTVGGLIGRNLGTIRNAYVRGSVDGEDFVGGLIGINNGSVDKTYAAATITASFFPGGLIALNDGEVSNSFFDQDVAGTTLGGAGTARSTAQMTDIATYTDTTSTGLIDPWDFVGLWTMEAGTNEGYPYFRAGAIEDPLFHDRFQSTP
jgi:hypothetical protein